MLKNTGWVLVLGAAVSLLSACATTSDDDTPVDALNGGNGMTTTVKTSGLGDNNGFADKDGKFGGAAPAGAEGLDGCSLKVGAQTYYFDFNKDNVRDHDLACIKVQADYLNAHPEAKALLEGYTDPRGSREYNVALGQRRADAVNAVLTQAGVAASQLRSVSYGAEKLASQGHTEADYALDRRVTIDYVQK